MDINPRRLINIGAERVSNVSNTEFPGHYPHEDHSWNLDLFKQNFLVQIHRLSQRSVEFDLIGIDASIANAFRRIMIAELPTIAIDQVYVFNNTSIIHDEVLAHRIGLVPLNVDPGLMDGFGEEGDVPTDRNTLEFRIKLECTFSNGGKGKDTSSSSPSDTSLYTNHLLLSKHFTWIPAGEQPEKIIPPAGPVNPNIVLAKLRPGQEVDMVLHARKGLGRDHAKWSPVATATYRLHPNIVLKKPIRMERGEEFKNCFADGVVVIDREKNTIKINPLKLRNDTLSREALRDPEFQDSIELSRIRDWFIFSVESESAYKPERMLMEAIGVMKEKIGIMRDALERLGVEGVGEDVVMEDL